MRQVWVLGSLLAVALVGSYLTWTSPESKTEQASEDQKVSVYNASEGDVQKIVWSSDTLTVSVEKKKDQLGEYTWITSTETTEKKPEKAAADSDTDAAASADQPVQKETKTSAFKGNDQADDLWKKFSPLMAMRELDATAATDKSVFGLDKPTATIEVTKKGGALTLPVGGETWGSKDKYVGLDTKVFLVDDADLRPIQYAKTRLVDRDLQPLAEGDIDQIMVEKGGKATAWVQQNKEDRAKAFWASPGNPQQEDAAGSAWIGKLLKLKVQAYADPSAPVPQLTPAFAFAMKGKGQTWKVEVLSDPTGEWYARSEYDRALVKLTKSAAGEAVADLDSVLSGGGGAPPEDDGAGDATAAGADGSSNP